MTEAWKSVPKKFCKICKCWFYDNKVSIQHHEQGSRHQFNVKNKLRELGKKGAEQQQVQFETRNALAKMEMEALRSYKKDLKEQPEIADNYNIHLNLAALPLKTHGRSSGGMSSYSSSNVSNAGMQQTHLKLAPGVSTVWRETLCPTSGRTFYWNPKTGQSRWDTPADGYLSLDEQAMEKDILEKERQDQPGTSGYSNAANADFGDLDNIPLPSVEKTPSETNGGSESSSDEQEEETLPDVHEKVSSGRGEVLKKNEDSPEEKESVVKLESKKKTPFGQWEVVEPPTRPKFAKRAVTAVEDSKEEKEVKKLKFMEKKMPPITTSSSSTTVVQFKKRSKFSGNLRSAKDDD